MSRIKQIFLLFNILAASQLALADHPNEGQVVISQLILEAENNNLELKQAEENLRALKSKANSFYGTFSPKVSLEGGPQTSKLDGDKTDGTSVYGKAEWNLFSGGADRANLDFQKYEADIQEKHVKLLKSKINREVSRVYFALQFILESISLKEKALEMNAQQMKIAKAKNISGFTSNSDVLEFDLRESTLRSDLVLLNQQLLQRSRELDVLLSRENSNAAVAVKGHLERQRFEPNRDQLVGKIKDNNEEILLSNLEIRRSEKEKTLAVSQFLPKLDFEAKYGKLASEETVYEENNNYTVALKLSIPLFSGFTDYNSVKSANSQLSAVKKVQRQKVISLTADLDSTLSEVKALNQRLDLEEKNLERSERYYKLTIEEYKRGVKNSPDVVGASERLIDARIRNLEYRRDLMLTKLKLEELSGN